MDELPDAEIESAEVTTRPHSHDLVSSADGSLFEHLRLAHQLDTDPGFSASTQEGLHDRLHQETAAADD